VKDLAADGVLAFFGAPVTSEDDPERAIRAGIRISEEMASYAEEVRRSFGQEGFGVRVGIATGTVVLGELTAGARVEYAAFGDSGSAPVPHVRGGDRARRPARGGWSARACA
jgi:class 3 adenylate cyclase